MITILKYSENINVVFLDVKDDSFGFDREMTMIYETEKLYQFSPFTKAWVATSGIMNFVDENKCYWLLDIIASYTTELKNADYLKIITVELKDGRRAVFKVTDEINGELITQDIEYTDLMCGIKWWAITEDDLTTVLLPEEY